MKCFVDNAGRTWTVAINVAAVKRVRAGTATRPPKRQAKKNEARKAKK